MAETQLSSGKKAQVGEGAVETAEVVNSLQQQPQAASPSVPEPHSDTCGSGRSACEKTASAGPYGTNAGAL